MEVEIYTDGAVYYLGRGGAGWRWQQENGRWIAVRAEVPHGAIKARFAELPPALQEELLAFAARAEALGNQA